MKSIFNNRNVSLYIGIAFLLGLILAEFVAIMILNSGFLVYTLDDPYIHLALAENILNGHYGINSNELSAPSSSPLWPFIIAPFSNYPTSLLVMNVCFAIASVFVVAKILNYAISIADNRIKNILSSIITVLFVLATNTVGLIYTGMEHSLQMLAVLIVAYGLIIEIEKNEVNWWLLAAIIIAPLVRYECLAISLPAIFYLMMRRYYMQTGITLIVLVLSLGAFSLFLASMGFGAFPSSVTAKSSVIQSGGAIGRFLDNFSSMVGSRPGKKMLFGMLMLIYYICSKGKIKQRKTLALATIFAILLHFIAGRYGWYNRYEIYILAFEIAIILYLFLPLIKPKFFSSVKANRNLWITIAMSCIVTLIIGKRYISDLTTIPLASNNIYEQQYQMHRFVTGYYQKPIAVNDLGYVSYKNDAYVLDMWGLGSHKALKSRLDSDGADWKRDLVNEANVGLVLIYDDWFENIPNEWQKLGELHLGKERVTPAQSMVAFYATSPDFYTEIRNKLNSFSQTLPAGVTFKSVN